MVYVLCIVQLAAIILQDVTYCVVPHVTQFFMSLKVKAFPLKLCLPFTWLNHIISADLSAAHLSCQPPVLLDSGQKTEDVTKVQWTHCHVMNPAHKDFCWVTWDIYCCKWLNWPKSDALLVCNNAPPPPSDQQKSRPTDQVTCFQCGWVFPLQPQVSLLVDRKWNLVWFLLW